MSLQTGAGEQLALQITDQYAATSATDLQIIRHSGAPTWPNLTHGLAATDAVNPALEVEYVANHGGSTSDWSFSCNHQLGWYEIPLRVGLGSGAPLGPASVASAAISSDNSAGNNKLVGAPGTFDDFALLVPCPVYLTRDQAVNASPIDSQVIALAVSIDGAELTIGKGTPTGTEIFDQVFGVDVGTVPVGDNVSVSVQKVWKVGTIEEYLLIEHYQAKIGAGVYNAALGAAVNSITLNAAKGSAPQWTFGGAAVGFAGGAGATFGTGTYGSYAPFEDFESGDDVLYRGVGGVFGIKDVGDPTAGFLMASANLSITPAQIAAQALGCDLPASHSRDQLVPTATVNLLASEAAQRERDKQAAKLESSLYMGWDKTVRGTRAQFSYWGAQLKYAAAPSGNGGNGSLASFDCTAQFYNNGAIGGSQGSSIVFAEM